MQIRRARIDDLTEMQELNLQCLPENYTLRYYIYHLVAWPQLSFVAVDNSDRVVGYVLSKIDEESTPENPIGHITSLSVNHEYRRLKLAEQLMRVSEIQMKKVYKAKSSVLHVRKSNEAAFNLYKNRLGFSVRNVDPGYYANGEDAYAMEKILNDDLKEDITEETKLETTKMVAAS